jgi:glycosyltransferase involved in cell wall biosynthesis
VAERAETVTTSGRTVPAISVVTTTFNRAHLLPRLWNSVKAEQASFEWIVVDDASADDTADVVASFDDPRISYIRHPVDRGGPAAGRNQGARAARGRYVVFLDDDDELFPGALARMVVTLDAAEPSIGCAVFQCQFPDGSRWREQVTHGAVYDEVDVVCRRVLGLEKIFVYRREVFDEFQLEEDLLFVEGVFVFGLTRRHKILMVNEPARVYHDTGVRNSSYKGLVRISPLIGRGYERILANHRDVLADWPEARVHYLTKALFRYSVAGARRDGWRVFREIARHGRLRATLFGLGLLLVALTRTGLLLERFRLPMVMRRSIARSRA